MVKLTCTEETFEPAVSANVRWLDWETDFGLAQAFWPPEYPLSREVWDQARDDGYRYCAIVQDKGIVAIAAEYRFSDDAWMVAAVKTAPQLRRRGYAKAVVSFATQSILRNGRTATCETADTNVAMFRTAESVGFRKS